MKNMTELCRYKTITVKYIRCMNSVKKIHSLKYVPLSDKYI